MKKLFYLSLAVLISASAVLSCKKSEENEDLHAVTKDYVLDGISATLNGALSLMEGEVLSTVYFLVSEKSKIPEDGTEIRIPGTLEGSFFSGMVSSLKYATTYYYRAMSEVDGKTYRGKIKNFRTEDLAVTGVSIDKYPVKVVVGKTVELKAVITPEGATNQKLDWQSKDPEVATVKNGVVTGKKRGSTTITVTTDDGGMTASRDIKVVNPCPEGAVDLGLSVYWATNNVGASKPSDSGEYYGWGETETKSPQNNEYFDESHYTYKDNPKVLPADHDVASVKWKENWRMPTAEEIQELLDNCTFFQTMVGTGPLLYEATSKVPGYTNKSISFPAAGYYSGYNKNLYHYDEVAWVWSSSLDESLYTSFAFHLALNSSTAFFKLSNRRFYGLPVRPVSD